MKPLILILNDDGLHVGGLDALVEVARDFGELVVMVPSTDCSARSHSLTIDRPVRVREEGKESWGSVYTCDGTPVDCAKMALEHYCPRRPDLVLSGINHGSNASINAMYSATVGAAREATMCGYASVAFSLLDHSLDADFRPCLPFVRKIIASVLANGLPKGITLNVNFPVPQDGVIKGVKVCRQSMARWTDSFEKRIDPHGRTYYWLTGKFECDDLAEDTDIRLLDEGYATIVPLAVDNTGYWRIEN